MAVGGAVGARTAGPGLGVADHPGRLRCSGSRSTPGNRSARGTGSAPDDLTPRRPLGVELPAHRRKSPIERSPGTSGGCARYRSRAGTGRSCLMIRIAAWSAGQEAARSTLRTDLADPTPGTSSRSGTVPATANRARVRQGATGVGSTHTRSVLPSSGSSVVSRIVPSPASSTG